MKTILTTAFIFYIILFSFACTQNQTFSSEKQVISLLNNFYTSYITERSKMPEDFDKINSLKTKFLTQKLITKIDTADIDELDYDPFLNAQYCDIEWLKTLIIRKESTDNNCFEITYQKNYFNTEKTSIKLIIIKQKDGFKIDSIL